MSIYSSELEQRITECYNVVDDIKAVYTAHQDLHELSVDRMANTLMGIEHLYQLKFELLIDTFEKHLKAIHEESSAVDYKLKPLTEKEADALLGKLSVGAVREDIRIIEAAHGIKGG